MADQPTTPETARAWLAWAAEQGHQPGCACHGCWAARRILRAEVEAAIASARLDEWAEEGAA